MSRIPNQISNNNSPRSESSWLVEVGKTIALSLVLAIGIRTFVAEARWIPSESMVPTLKVNDKLIVDKLSYDFTNPARGDIVVFSPTDNIIRANPSLKEAFIKRIIGIPGDKVEVKGERVYVNNRPLQEKYIEDAPHYQFGPVVVPPNSYLVLGDNRNDSWDSHYWGFVPRNHIIGHAIVRFWPIDRIGELNQRPQ